MKVVKLSAKHTDRLNVQRDIPDTRSCYKLSQTQGNLAAGKPMNTSVMKPPTFRLVQQCFKQMPDRINLYFTKIIQIIQSMLRTHKKANVYIRNSVSK